MGWGEGAAIMDEVIKAVHAHVTNIDVRLALYKNLIMSFEQHDWDTQRDCLGKDPMYDLALYSVHPDWFKDLSENDGK